MADAIWTPEDMAELREVAERFPLEIAESPVLADICEREGIR